MAQVKKLTYLPVPVGGDMGDMEGIVCLKHGSCILYRFNEWSLVFPKSNKFVSVRNRDKYLEDKQKKTILK